MKIAVFHNYLDNIGGAEVVALTLARELSADLYTTNINPEKIRQMGFGDVLERIISIGRLPKQAPFRQQLAFYYFRRLNLKNQYDFFIIAGDWAMSAAVNNKPNMWYAHSPLNELWAFKSYIRENILSAWKKIPYDIWVKFNRILSRRYASFVDIFIANSLNTKKRIKHFYDKEATVIYPPVEINKNAEHIKGDYWLSVNRLITHKRIDIQLKAFKSLPNEKLVIVGSYEKGVAQFEAYKKYLDSLKPDNVTIYHWVDNLKLKELYLKSLGFIATAKDEDFGMTPVEAMAFGKPVIAAKEGGYQESVISGKTGILIEDIDENKLMETIKEIRFELEKNPDKYREDCLARAREFSVENFSASIKKTIAGYFKV